MPKYSVLFAVLPIAYFVLCDMQIFPGSVYHRKQPHAQSLFTGWINAWGRPLVFEFLRCSILSKRTPYIWICDSKGVKLRVGNFQVVALVRRSEEQVWLYFIPRASKLGFDRVSEMVKNAHHSIKSEGSFNLLQVVHYKSSSPRLPKATSTPTAGSAPGANSAKKKKITTPSKVKGVSIYYRLIFAYILLTCITPWIWHWHHWSPSIDQQFLICVSVDKVCIQAEWRYLKLAMGFHCVFV